MDDVKLAGNEPRCEIASRLDPLGPFWRDFFPLPNVVMCVWVTHGYFQLYPYPYPHPAGFSGQNEPQIIQVLSELCLKQSIWSYLTQYLTVLDDLGLILKCTGMGICTCTHTHEKTCRKPTGTHTYTHH